MQSFVCVCVWERILWKCLLPRQLLCKYGDEISAAVSYFHFIFSSLFLLELLKLCWVKETLSSHPWTWSSTQKYFKVHKTPFCLCKWTSQVYGFITGLCVLTSEISFLLYQTTFFLDVMVNKLDSSLCDSRVVNPGQLLKGGFKKNSSECQCYNVKYISIYIWGKTLRDFLF